MPNYIVILNVALFISIVIFSLSIAKYLLNKNIDKVVRNGLNILISDEEDEVIKIKNMFYKKQKRKSKYIKTLKLFVDRSNIRTKFRWMNHKMVILISCGFSFSSLIFSYKLSFYNILLVMGAFYFIPFVVLAILSDFNGAKADIYLTVVLNIILGYLGLKDDISYAVDECSDKVAEPFLSYFKEYASEVENVTPAKALENLSSKIDNSQFQFYIRILILCSKNSGKFKLITERFRDNYVLLTDEMMFKKSEAKKNRFELLIFIVVCAISMIGLTFVNPHFKLLLTTTRIGNIIVFFSILVYIFTLYTAFDIGRFKYD